MGISVLNPRKSWAPWDEMVTLPARFLSALVKVRSHFVLIDRRQTAGGCPESTKDGIVSLACGLIN